MLHMLPASVTCCLYKSPYDILGRDRFGWLSVVSMCLLCSSVAVHSRRKRTHSVISANLLAEAVCSHVATLLLTVALCFASPVASPP
jgi:hypothetical protein